VQEARQAVLLEPDALALGEHPRDHGVLGNSVRAVDLRSYRLVGRELLERVAAAGGVDQVGRHHRVVRQRRRRAVGLGGRQRLPVVRHERPLAPRHRHGGEGLRLAHEHLLVTRPGGEAQRAGQLLRQARKLAVDGLRPARRQRQRLLVVGGGQRGAQVGHRHLSRADLDALLGALARGRLLVAQGLLEPP
jgi:hypothetical protein